MSKQKRGAIGSSKYRREIVGRFLARHPFCHYCQKRLDTITATVDHYIPLVQGGENKVSNFVLACRRCNTLKGDKMPWEFQITDA